MAPRQPAPYRPVPLTTVDNSLLTKSSVSPVPLGGGWDIDFISLQLTPGTLHLFSPWWNLGGSCNRILSGPRNTLHDPFPQGLELCNASPFTLRVQLDDAANLANFGDTLARVLRACGPTTNPLLIRPTDPVVSSRQFALETRMCSADQLSTALTSPLLSPYGPCKIFLGRYGMKVPAAHFFNNSLLPALNQMLVEVPEQFSHILHNMRVDWATQSTLSGNIICTKFNQLKSLPFPAQLVHYTQFGQLGNGYGGFSLLPTCAKDPPAGIQEVLKVNVYSSGWAHHLKCVGMPNTRLPPGATNQWLVRQKAKFEGMLGVLGLANASALGGCRVEIRTLGHLMSWPLLEEWLQGILHEVMARTQVFELAPPDVLHACRTAFGSACTAGVFSTSSTHGNLPIAPWKKASFYRLLQVCGIVHITSMKASMTRDLQGVPWGDPQAAVPDMEAAGEVELMSNPHLPDTIPIVQMPSDLGPTGVAKLGMKHGHVFDWPMICQMLGCPSMADTLHQVCTHTRWRKCPQGGAKGGSPQFTATWHGRRGMCGPLGCHLALATINLVANNLHTQVQRL